MNVKWHLCLVSTLFLLLQHLTHCKCIIELLKCNYPLMPVNQTVPGKGTSPWSVFKIHGSCLCKQYGWIIVKYLNLQRALAGPAPTHWGIDGFPLEPLSPLPVCHLNTAGQKFLVGNLAGTGATLWSSKQTLWDGSAGEVIQVLKKLDLNILTCFSLEKTFLILKLQ